MNAGAVSDEVVGFKSHLRAEVSDGKGVFLFSEDDVTSVCGAYVEPLATLLDGTRDIATLLRARPGGLDAEQVAGLITQLVDAGLVTIRPAPASEANRQSVAYWDACGIDPDANRAQPGAVVRLMTVGDVAGSELMETALYEAGFHVRTGPEPATADAVAPDLSVVVCDDYLNPALSEIDRVHRRAGRTWLLTKPVGTQMWIGPFFRPGSSACWHCLSGRLWGNRHAEACAQATLGRKGPASRPVVAVPPVPAAAASLVALEVTKWFAGHRYRGQNCVWTLDTIDLAGCFHEVRARPQCPECGDTDLVRKRTCTPVRLRSAPKVAGSGSGHRTMPPDRVLDHYRHLISPITGVVKEITRDPASPAAFNAFRSGPNFGARATGMGSLRRSLREESGGKGVTALDAEVSALCEALERYSGRFQGDEHRVRASLRSLGDAAVHPNECMLFHERQYANRSEWNAAHADFQHVCAPFDERAVMDWTPVWSLTGNRQRLLPTGMLYYGAPATEGTAGVCADSNGSAAGSSLEDAVLQGLLELVERDAVALWWYNRTAAPGLDLDAFDDPWVGELRAVYARLGREVWALDVTSDLGVPTVVAVSRRVDSSSERIMFGFGSHLDPRIALRRALTELNQLTSAAAEHCPEGEPVTTDPDALRWWNEATVANQPYVRPDPRAASRGPSDFEYTTRQDVVADVDSITGMLERRGLETLVLEQTRPDIGLPVAKVIVPGMRHFWARLGPGRLYDVPVELGRVTEPTPYEDLNPLPLFL